MPPFAFVVAPVSELTRLGVPSSNVRSLILEPLTTAVYGDRTALLTADTR
jgi:hypothetical protein